MKHLTLFTAIALIGLGCGKDDTPKAPPPDTFGEVLIVVPDSLDFATSVVIDSADYSLNQTRVADCGDADNAAKKIKLKSGTHELNASNDLLSWTTKITVSENECKIIELKGTNSVGEKRGKVLFYTVESGIRKINVTLDGKVIGSIRDLGVSPRPIGLLSPPIVAVLSPGIYIYQAESENGHKWAGSAKFITGKTAGVSLGKLDAKPIGANETSLIFYSSTSNPGTPEIKVYLNGEYVGATLSNYDPGTADLCIAKYVVSVIKPKGTYSYTASSSEGRTWSGSVTATGAGDCQLVKLE